MRDDDAAWDGLIDGLRRGDAASVERFCAEYGAALERLADRRLAPKLQRRVGPEDIVQSAYRTFLRRVQAGQFRLPDSDRLWRLLCAITLNKVRKHARRHLAAKRSLNREVHLDAVRDADDRALEIEARTVDPAREVEFADAFEHLLARFGEQERRLIDLKLQQYTNAEAAERLGCSERTVRRLLAGIQHRLEEGLGRD